MPNRKVTLVRLCKTEAGWRRYPAVIVGPDRVSLYIPIAGYYQDKKDVRRVSALKPWLYF